MLKNYFKIALRTIRRNSVYSIISILGLAIAITGATLLYLYVNNELSYDGFHDKAERVYRVVEIYESSESETRYFGQNSWLNRFAFHADLGIEIFAAAAAVVLLLSVITISWQAIKGALMNPVDSLRSE